MPILRVHLANCPIGAEHATQHSTGGWRRDRIELSLAGLAVVLRQTDSGMPGRHRQAKGRTVHTTSLDFGDVPSGKRRWVEGVANDVACLLSAATMSPVTPFRYEFGQTSRSVSITTRTSIFRPTIETISGSAVRTFIECTWPTFRRLKFHRRLVRVVNYLVLAEHPDQPIEVSTLLMLTALESLKSTHSPGQRGRFVNRVKQMLSEVGMQRGLTQLVKLRNRLVHEGLAGVPNSTLCKHHDRLHDILREYLLRLLEYQGPYLLYSAASRESRMLSRRAGGRRSGRAKSLRIGDPRSRARPIRS